MTTPSTDFQTMPFHQSNSPELRGSQAYDQFAIMYRTAFPDLRFNMEDLIAAGNKVVQRWTASGTHEGELMGIPATGKHVSNTGISIYRLAGSVIVEEWVNWSALSMLQQLGVIPPMG